MQPKINSKFNTLIPQERLHQLVVPLIGITGGIASGKSTVSEYLQAQGFCVIFADQLVKNIYQTHETHLFIQNLCPSAVKDGLIDFKILREKFFTDHKIKKTIEDYIYLKIPDEFKKQFSTFKKPEVIFYEVPLLFEKKLEKKFDQIILVSASIENQMERLTKRDNVDSKLAQEIISHQLSNKYKEEKSHFIISNTSSKEELVKQIDHILSLLFT